MIPRFPLPPNVAPYAAHAPSFPLPRPNTRLAVSIAPFLWLAIYTIIVIAYTEPNPRVTCDDASARACMQTSPITKEKGTP